MALEYIALLRKEDGTDYGVDFPDLPGCVTAGSTLEEARRNAAEALQFHLEGLTDAGQDIPAPSDLDEIMGDPHNADAVVLLVAAPARQSRAKKINITMNEDLLDTIDALVTAGDAPSRSGFIAAAAQEQIKKQREAA
jgi:predicted RNase H-like HicB family nuclease